MRRPRIAVLGIFAADVTSRVARLPRWHETLIGEGASLGPGGKGSNQAVAAARLGAEVTLIAKIGADSFGELARGLYAREGIDTAHLAVDPEAPTGVALILVDAASGKNAIVVNPGAALLLGDAEIEAAQPAIAAADVFLTQLELPVARVARGIALAREAGVPVIFNPAPAAPFDRALLAAVDVATPNEVEAAALLGFGIAGMEDARRAARALRDLGARAAVVTLGEKGSFLASAEEEAHVPARPVPHAIDTTGAGDAFNGALAVALAERRPLREAVRFATVAASLSVERPGAAFSMPSRAEVDAVLARERSR
ncbi:MAG TPA: ribokinase [Stellaceae bacterium]|nr:ribokinase [Stellaceae bacterium]